MEIEYPVEAESLRKLCYKSMKRGLDFFSPPTHDYSASDPVSKKTRLSHKLANFQDAGSQNRFDKSQFLPDDSTSTLALSVPRNPLPKKEGYQQNSLGNEAGFAGKSQEILVSDHASSNKFSSAAIMEGSSDRRKSLVQRPQWKNYRVLSNHLGWVRAVAFDPSNEWFCTGSADRTIKIWDLASGRLQHTLTGHIGQVRSLAVSNRQTYMFSAGDDKQVKCWDLEQNKVIRSFHGHLSGVYCMALHPTIDVLVTGGRDSVCRVWDIRTKVQIHSLSGHDNTVCSVFTRSTDPQVVTGSHDTTIKFWDLRYGKTMATLTHHKKSVRAMVPHPLEDNFASASPDSIKKFNLPKGQFMHNMASKQNTIINAMAVNREDLMVTGGDDGSLRFWDWKTRQNFQHIKSKVQPGSLDCEAAIYAASFDVTGSRLVTCEADKTVKIWKEEAM
ncbi:PP1/PP2A phosphatases pleiotropic regulator PRL1 [Heracleum sosnowskyi]|uniref:PP1/PP2A phosphatases pleiotropic regulator PRL1 n=1 Tax=Heracleum sosnowskyi TaxID=360622 RepID=A0AAD8H0R0_9APIA|nr:PP1/PP2A phosphatases pleiotropic regulator PRL1 [Heracleum sosnowskyi]